VGWADRTPREEVIEHPDGLEGKLLEWVPYGGKGRIGHGCCHGIIETDHGDIFGDAPSRFVQGAHCPDSH
jgi:hypothetical protein